MTPEYTRLDPALERAVTEIRDESVDPAVVEAAAARVWARLADEVAQASRAAQEHIRGCADFQALIPEYRAGRLPEARGLLLKDHLHQCVACRHVFEGKVVAFPAPRAAHRAGHPVRWAAAAVVVAAAGLSIWIAVDQYGARTGRAIVQSVNGTLYEVSAAGIRPLAPGQALPDGIEVRTANDSDAMLELRDGSVVELRERSGLSATQMACDVTVHLGRGSIIVQAARRRSGHLFVDTADCRVSVTGTVFSVSAGVKGSRISVVQGEVHVTQDNQEKILHPGNQAVTSPSLEPLPVKEDISWSRNRERLLQQLNSLRTGLEQLHLPALRYSSRLLERLPVSTVLYASIPNLGQYLGQAESVFREQTAGSPNLRALWAGHGFDVEAVLDKLRAASEYLGDEIAIVAFAGSNEKPLGPVFFAETRRDGFPEFLKKTGLPLTVDSRPGLVAFSPTPGAVEAFARVLNAPSGGFPGTPFYARIAESYRNGAGLLLCADLSRLAPSGPLTGVRYFIAEQKEVHGQMEASASLGFDGARTGIAAWLADPSPMGALDYVSPDASFAAAFVVKDPAAIVDFAVSTERRLAGGSAGEPSSTGPRDDLAGGLGG